MRLLLIILTTSILAMGCEKDTPLWGPPSPMVIQPVNPGFSKTPSSNAILVDASRDGGVWWSPQTSNYTWQSPHQGKALADHLRSQGFTVDEVGRGMTVSWDLLKNYSKVIRVGGYGNRTQAEIAAYDSLLQKGASVFYMQDHLNNHPNDNLSFHLGLNFTGAHIGNISHFAQHPITQGVHNINYIAGSVITTQSPNLTPLGYVSINEQQVIAMGILHHSKSKIFFIGDANGIQSLPQPFTNNVINWLFK